MKLNELLAYALHNTIILVKDNKSKKTIAYGEAQAVMKSLKKDSEKVLYRKVEFFYTDFEMDSTVFVVLVE